MKKFRKGFTLVELLIVIGVIGILSSMAMMGGTEATNIANANKIIEEFKIIGAAMNMYYADNRSAVEAALAPEVAATETAAAIPAETWPARIKNGIAAYMKNTDSIAEDAAEGKYNITVQGSEWWLTYTLPLADTKLAKILENKAAQEGLMASTTTSTTAGTTTTYTPSTGTYKSTGKSVCYQVR